MDTEHDDKQPNSDAKRSPLDRYFSVLEIIAAHPGVSAAEIAQLCTLPFPTVHRLIQGLRAEGLLVGDRRKNYQLGPRLLRLLQAGSDESWISITVQKRLDRVADLVSETCYLAKLAHDSVISVAWATPAGGLKGHVIPGLTQPLHAAACAKAILAHQDEGFVRSLVKEPLPKLAINTVTRYDDFLQELAIVRDRGYATCINENEYGVTAIACPVLLDRTGVMYSIGVMALGDRLPSERFADIADKLKVAAADLALTVASESLEC